jgi:geranylgeranyl diphosphate synthase type II
MDESDLDQYLARRRELIEESLDRVVGADGSALREAMRYSLLDGGKRIRPILLLAAGEAVEASIESMLPFACGIEMIHSYSLVHDDLPSMDDDELRRGRPTTHVRYGEALAILVGDGLLTDAFALMASATESLADPVAGVRVIREIAAAAGSRGMVAGQADDIAAEGGGAGLVEVERIHRRKTGALLRAAARSGAILGGADEAALDALTAYGECLGLAFQVVDDVLDATAGSDTTGKVGGRDRELGKRTYVEITGVDGARAQAVELRERALAAVAPLAPAADPLRALVRYVVGRATD